jgi:TP53 regulating kinase-like protein
MRWKFFGDDPTMLIRKGAEASIFLEEWHDRQVVMKTRLPKAYRVDRLDSSIRLTRTSREAHLLHDSKGAGVPTPTVYEVDTATCTIIMDYVSGPRLKEAFFGMDDAHLRRTCCLAGSLVGRLHLRGIVHGDLTTSNMILRDGDKLFFIDFGLSGYANEPEARGVDLLLMNRAFKSTHYALHSRAFEAVLDGYRRVMGRRETECVLTKMREIEKRGRYSERRQTNLVPNS